MPVSVRSQPKRYEREQINAMCSAVVDGGLSTRQARDALAAGDLPVAAVDMPITSARTYVYEERKRRRVRERHPLARKPPLELAKEALSMRASSWAKQAEDSDSRNDAQQESLDRRLKLLVAAARDVDAAELAAARARKGKLAAENEQRPPIFGPGSEGT